MHILALDLAGQTGWARWRPGMERPAYGVARLPKRCPGQTFAALRDFLIGKIVGEGIEHVAVEAPYIDKNSLNAVERLYGMSGHVQEICYTRGVCYSPVSTGEWRKFMIGTGMAPRTVAKAHRREWLKKQVKTECEKRGWAIQHYDESDALGVLAYERARLLPQWGVEGDLFGYNDLSPLGMERIPG